MATRERILVLHMAGRYPMGGMVWQAIHYVLPLRRMGYDAYYVEDSGAPPYDPRVKSVVADPSYNIAFLRASMEAVGLGDRWVYHDLSSGACHGLSRATLQRLYREADAILNLCGATTLREEHLACPLRLYVQTDPVYEQIRAAEGDPETLRTLGAHTHLFTYGENLGQPDCPVPVEGFDWRPTRPPVLLDLWEAPPPPPAAPFTTVATFRNVGKDIAWRGVSYRWSKDENFLAMVELPERARVPLELALEAPAAVQARFLAHGWLLSDPLARSRDLDTYRRYIQASRGEFTVAKDLMARPRPGWFSDRSVCYLAAGRPVVTLDTGFGKFVPTGEGLLAYSSLDEAAAALETVAADWPRHARAARAIAAEHFAAERVL
ncbi:MAG TPA: hypothetical protein VNN07_06190, partial [Candidatus Tectomicrobia bacterium]|nr:hypothetical protein [Candidatus Tectomicrobia bacterium]